MTKVYINNNQSSESNLIWRTLSLCSRAFFTAATILLFYFLAIFLALFLLLDALTGRNREKRKTLARSFISRALSIFWQLVGFLGLAELEVEDLSARTVESSAFQPLVIVSNHPTFIDALVLLHLFPEAQCVVKPQVWRHLILGPIVRSAGYVSSKNSHYVIEDCVKHLVAGDSIIIFPEGTRSPENGIGPFHRGAAHIASRSNTGFLRVVIHTPQRQLTKARDWYRGSKGTVRLGVSIYSPIATDTIESHNQHRAYARKITRELHDFYCSQVNR